MNINDAYEFVMDKLETLKKDGFEIEMNDPPFKDEKDYNKPGRLNPDKWKIVMINIDKDGDMAKIYSIEDLCKMMGIYFDTGISQGKRDWMIDWSFRIN